MHKYLIFVTISFTILISSKIYSQAYLDFISDTACFGHYTKITNISYVKDSISQVNWDLNNDTIFNDAYGDTVKFIFPSEGTHKIGLQIITKTSDTLIIYKEIIVNPSPIPNLYYINPCFGSYTYFIDYIIN